MIEMDEGKRERWILVERETLRFQSFLVNKKQREAAAAANGAVPGTPGYRSW